MRRLQRLALILSVAATLTWQTGLAEGQARDARTTDAHWVATWGTAQQLARVTPPAPGAARGQGPGATPAAPAAQAAPSVPPAPATQAAPAQAVPAGQAVPAAPAGRGNAVFRVQTVNNQTIRMVLRTSIGGKRARITLSNAFGAQPVVVGAAHLAVRASGAGTVDGSDRPLTFAGKSSFRMWPGMVVVSDPVDLDIAPLTDLAVSLYFPSDTGLPTSHATGLRPAYVSKDGDFTGQSDFPVEGTTQSYYWLASVDVLAPPETSLIVAFGDSITDGARSTPDTHNTWPALLAARLAANKETANFAVLNAGIGGNRLLSDGGGVAALSRLDRDVLNQPGVKWLMVLEGINDIGTLATAAPDNRVTSADLIWALQQIADRAHARGIKVVGCTLTPYGGAGYATEEGEAIRSTVNTWIRSSKTFDAVVDFEAATRDPNAPTRFRPEFDPGDHLHPNDAGYKAMAEAIDLSIFNPRLARTKPPAKGAKRPSE